MKILTVNNFFYPRVGGSAMISQQLTELYKACGHEVMVLTGEYANSNTLGSIEPKLNIKRIPSWNLPKTKMSFNFDINFCLRLGNRRRVNKILSSFNPDVVHLHGQFLDLTWKTLRWCKKSQTPSILTLHTRLYNPNRFINFLFLILDKCFVYLILRLYPPSKIVCIDSVFEEYVNKRYKKLNGRSVTIPIGVKLERFLVKQHRKQRVNKVPVIASIGHIIAVRNRHSILKALKILKVKYPGIKLIIVGNDYLAPNTMQLIKQLELVDNVVLMGALPHEKVPEILDIADLEIHDTHGTGFNLSTIESMARGVPTIVSSPLDYYRHATLVNGSNTMIIKPENVDDLVKTTSLLLEDPLTYSKISHDSIMFAKDFFDLIRVSQDYLKLFKEVSFDKSS